jgi:hypothetical protein
VRKKVGLEVEPMVCFRSRHHQGVPGSKRAIGQKSDAVVVFPNEIGRQLAVDDPGEYG